MNWLRETTAYENWVVLATLAVIIYWYVKAHKLQVKLAEARDKLERLAEAKAIAQAKARN